MKPQTRKTLEQLLETSFEALSVPQVQDLAAAAREVDGLADVLVVTELKQITPARLEAWQAVASDLLVARDQQKPSVQTSAPAKPSPIVQE